jgi:hypothetical protein
MHVRISDGFDSVESSLDYQLDVAGCKSIEALERTLVVLRG